MDPLPRILYHGTTADLAPAIERAGLRPRRGQGPFLTSDPKRARGYAVRASCLAATLAGEPDPDLLPDALLVIATAPAEALVPDPAHRGDYWLRDPSAARLRLEVFPAQPHITSAAEVRKYAAAMETARRIEDHHGQARRRAAEGLLPDEEEATPHRPHRGAFTLGTMPDLGTRPALGTKLR